MILMTSLNNIQRIGKLIIIEGVSKNNLSDYEGAKSDFSKSIELNPNLWAPSFNGRGFSKQMLGDHNGAISDFTKSIELDKGRSYPYGARAYSKGEFRKTY